jgi:hypothetical protein
VRLSALRPAGSSGISPEGQSYAEFLGRHGAFLGQTNRSCPTLSRRPPWRCIGATMVTSTFAEFEAPAYGELVKPPPLRRCWSEGVSVAEAPSVSPDFYRIFYRMDRHSLVRSGTSED